MSAPCGAGGAERSLPPAEGVGNTKEPTSGAVESVGFPEAEGTNLSERDCVSMGENFRDIGKRLSDHVAGRSAIILRDDGAVAPKAKPWRMCSGDS